MSLSAGFYTQSRVVNGVQPTLGKDGPVVNITDDHWPRGALHAARAFQSECKEQWGLDMSEANVLSLIRKRNGTTNSNIKLGKCTGKALEERQAAAAAWVARLGTGAAQAAAEEKWDGHGRLEREGAVAVATEPQVRLGLP